VFIALNSWIKAYLGILVIIYGIVFWMGIKALQLFVFLVAVLFSSLVYGISFCIGQVLKGRVVPIFAKKG
jgi:hypothetical protein